MFSKFIVAQVTPSFQHPRRDVLEFNPFSEDETVAQRGQVTCLRLHRGQVQGLGFKPRLWGSEPLTSLPSGLGVRGTIHFPLKFSGQDDQRPLREISPGARQHGVSGTLKVLAAPGPWAAPAGA